MAEEKSQIKSKERVRERGEVFTAEREVADGEFVPVRITGSMDGELTGELWEE